MIYHFLTGDLTPEERMKLDEWLALPGHADLFRRICDKERLLQGTLRYDSYDKEDAWRRLERQLREARVTEEVISALVLRALRCISPRCPVQVLLNQADTPDLETRGEAIAGTIRAAGYSCAVCALQRRKRAC